MLITDIKRVVEQISRDKGIDRNVLIQALEEALKSAARKKYGNEIDIEVQYNEDTGEIEVFQFKEVVEQIDEPDLQIGLAEGRKLDPEAVSILKKWCRNIEKIIDAQSVRGAGPPSGDG